MQRNQADLVGLLAQELGRCAGDEGIADAVETILAQTVAARDVLVNGVGADVLGDSGVELAIEAGDVACPGEVLDAQPHDAEAVRVVERRQIVQGLQMVVGAVGYQLRLGVVAAMNDAVADDANVVLAFDIRQVLVLDEGVQYDTEGIPLLLDRFGHLTLVDNGPLTSRILERRRRRG